MRAPSSLVGHTLAGLLVLVPMMATAQWDAEDYKPQFSFHRQPTVSVFYGFGLPYQDGLQESLAPQGALDIRLGGSRIRWAQEDAQILKSHYEFVTLSTISPRLGKRPGPDEIRTDLWRFGGAFERGLGYGGDPRDGLAVILSNSGGMTWTDVQVRGDVADSADLALLTRYEGPLRFGTTTEAAVKVRVTQILMIEGTFERSLIFPRHLFAKWVGSSLIELVAQGLLDGFVGKVLESTPSAAPIAAFLLKNGLSYGFYELRRSQMNWPFSSEAPYALDTFKVGMTLVF